MNGDVITGKYIGSSKFDKLRRISVIKPVAEMMELKDGDEVSFYQVEDEIVIRKRQTKDKNIEQLMDEYFEKLEKTSKRSFDSDTFTFRLDMYGAETLPKFDITELNDEQKREFTKRYMETITGCTATENEDGSLTINAKKYVDKKIKQIQKQAEKEKKTN